MTPVLLRQDNGETLVLDGVVGEQFAPILRIPAHRTERKRDVVDDVSEELPAMALSVVFSETPTVAGLSRGVERLEEVRAFFDGVRDAMLSGTLALLTYDDGRMPPTRDLMLQGWPRDRRVALNERYNLTLRQVRVAKVSTVDLGDQGATSDTARADVASSRSGEDDRGTVSTKSIAASADDATLGITTGLR